jgi:hypothetical protein
MSNMVTQQQWCKGKEHMYVAVKELKSQGTGELIVNYVHSGYIISG